jgi:maltooligosyltrehalose synthase
MNLSRPHNHNRYKKSDIKFGSMGSYENKLNFEWKYHINKEKSLSTPIARKSIGSLKDNTHLLLDKEKGKSKGYLSIWTFLQAMHVFIIFPTFGRKQHQQIISILLKKTHISKYYC